MTEYFSTETFRMKILFVYTDDEVIFFTCFSGPNLLITMGGLQGGLYNRDLYRLANHGGFHDGDIFL